MELSVLIELAKGGDSGAFREIVERTEAEVFTLAYRLCGNRDDALDISQEAFVRAYRALGTFRGESSFQTWMYRITANVASTHLKRRISRRTESFPEGFDPADRSFDAAPDAVAVHRDFRRQVDAAVHKLPPKLRAVVVLRDVYDMSHDAIADELGISVPAAKVRLHRARAQLKAELLGSKSVLRGGGGS